MTRTRTHERRRRGWIGTLAALLLLVVGGFVCGALAGFLWEEPRLVMAYLTGEAETLDWSEPALAEDAEDSPPPVAAAPPAGAPVRPEPSHPEPTRQAPAFGAAQPAASPAAEPARAATPRGPEPGGGFAVQVGAFGESRSAERLAARLRESGFDTYVTPAASEGGSRWRVRVGPVPEREAAERLARRLKRDEKLPTWVLEEDEG